MEEEQPVHISTSEEIAKKWDGMSSLYSGYYSPNLLFEAINIAALIDCDQADTIVEAACGDGALTTELCITKKPTAKLLSYDLSLNQCKYTYGRVQHLAELVKEPFGLSQYRHKLDEAQQKLKIEDIEFAQGEKKTIEKFNCDIFQGNSENLSVIESESVDRFVAPLSLNIVTNTDDMVKEVFRVLKSGGKAVFSVWGKKENMEYFTVIPTIFKKHGIERPKKRGPFHLNDKEKLIQRFESNGFKNVMAWNQFVPFKRLDSSEMKILTTRYLSLSLKGVAEETAAKIRDEVLGEYQKVWDVAKKTLGMETIVLIAEK